MSKRDIITLISEGRKFQPALYCMKVMESEINGINPDKLIWCYQYVLDPKKYPEFEIERESELIRQTIEHIKEYRDKILKGRFYLAPKESSKYCKYRSACGYIKYKTEEKGNNSGFWEKH
jgi:hypothetical protein